MAEFYELVLGSQFGVVLCVVLDGVALFRDCFERGLHVMEFIVAVLHYEH